MRYDIDTFVNSNSYNYNFTNEPADDVEMFEAYPANFATVNNIAHDTVNQQADPVFVYELAGVPVAWYDCENAVGFVAK
jgi:hypothetical protein